MLSGIEQGARLITLTGPGGTGKTRLAIEAATSLVGSYKAGVFWVGLATLRDPALVTETIAQTLGAKDDLAAHIAERELLLLLDNLEQVIEAAPELSALLAACPNLTLLVTSRELLRIPGEVEYAVPPLAEPEAVALFCARSQLEPSDEIAELCARLDSLPLAVELAAARTKALSPAQILERLSQRLDLLKGGRDADPRQQTLRATIEWSYELLSPAEQQLFARLSVFAGGCTLEAAEEVADADLDTLQSLVEKSLLRFSERALLDARDDPGVRDERMQASGEIEGLGRVTRRTTSRWLSGRSTTRQRRRRPSRSGGSATNTTTCGWRSPVSWTGKRQIRRCASSARSPTTGSCAGTPRKASRMFRLFSPWRRSSRLRCGHERLRSGRISHAIRETSQGQGRTARRACPFRGSWEIIWASVARFTSSEKPRWSRSGSTKRSTYFTKPSPLGAPVGPTVPARSATSATSPYCGATTKKRGSSPNKPFSSSATGVTRAALQ